MRAQRQYEPELKGKIIRLQLEEGRTKKSLSMEYQLGQGTLTYWLQQHHIECQFNPNVKEQADACEENRRLRKKLAEQEKEMAFLKRAAVFFAKEID